MNFLLRKVSAVYNSSMILLSFSNSRCIVQTPFIIRHFVSYDYSYVMDKVFDKDSENNKVWKVMNSYESYNDTLSIRYLQSKDVIQSLEGATLLSKFVHKSENIDDIGNIEKYFHHDDLNLFLKELNDVNFDKLVCCIVSLSFWPRSESHKSVTFSSIWKSLDASSCKLLKDLTVDQSLVLADCWFLLRLNRLCIYNEKFIENMIIKQLEEISPKQFVQFMFYVNLERKLPKEMRNKAEKKFLTVIDSLNIDEIGIVCLAFFKIQHGLESLLLLQKVVSYTVQNLDDIDNLAITSILKCIRKTTQNHSINSLLHYFLCCCENIIDRLEITPCLHLSMLGSYSNVYNGIVLAKIFDKCSKNIKTLRLKEISQLMFTAALFNQAVGDKFLSLINKELYNRLKTGEVKFYPRQFLNCLISMTNFGLYDHNLSSRLLDEKFLKLLHEDTNYDSRRDLFDFDCSISIECPDYCGNKLSDDKRMKFRKAAERMLTNNAVTFQSKMTDDLHRFIIQLLGESNNVKILKILPHFANPDVIFPLEKGKIPKNDVIFPCEMTKVSERNWMCFVIGGKNSYCYQSKEPLGTFNKKIRQLEKLGYNVVEVPWYDYWRLNPNKKLSYLQSKLKSYV